MTTWPNYATAGTVTATHSPKTRTVPAIVQDANASLSHPLLLRYAFEELGLQLVGVAFFQGKATCFIKHPGNSTHMIYTVGDVIDGHRIAAIQDNSVTFEREGVQFWLMLNDPGESDRDPAETTEYALDAPEATAGVDPSAGVPDPIIAKIDNIFDTAPQLKSRTSKYESAQLIEDAGDDSRDGSRSRDDSRSRKTSFTTARSMKFIMPIDGELTSSFGYRRDPWGGGRRYHYGVDLAAPYGTSVHAAADGVVTQVRRSFTRGRYVTIRHDNGYETLYLHLSKQMVEEGDRIKQGGVIGREGSTGRSTGPHLHFEIHHNGRAIDPSTHLKIK